MSDYKRRPLPTGPRSDTNEDIAGVRDAALAKMLALMNEDGWDAKMTDFGIQFGQNPELYNPSEMYHLAPEGKQQEYLDAEALWTDPYNPSMMARGMPESTVEELSDFNPGQLALDAMRKRRKEKMAREKQARELVYSSGQGTPGGGRAPGY